MLKGVKKFCNAFLQGDVEVSNMFKPTSMRRPSVYTPDDLSYHADCPLTEDASIREGRVCMPPGANQRAATECWDISSAGPRRWRRSAVT